MVERRAFQAGWNEMVELAAHAAKPHEFPANSLRVPLTEIAKPSHGDARYSRTGHWKEAGEGRSDTPPPAGPGSNM